MRPKLADVPESVRKVLNDLDIAPVTACRWGIKGCAEHMITEEASTRFVGMQVFNLDESRWYKVLIVWNNAILHNQPANDYLTKISVAANDEWLYATNASLKASSGVYEAIIMSFLTCRDILESKFGKEEIDILMEDIQSQVSYIKLETDLFEMGR